MKTEDIKKLSEKELRVKLEETRNELLSLRLRKQTGQVEKPHMLAELRKDVARILTFIKLKEEEVVAS